MENNDKILKDFFAENKKEITDNGFSHNVMRNLPEKKHSIWIVPVFGLIGFYIALFLSNTKEMLLKIYLLVEKINPLYIPVFFFAVPFVVLFVWYLNEKKYHFWG